MGLDKPLDALNQAKDDKVVVELKNGVTYSGILQTFDVHINIVLDEAEEHVNGEIKRKLGRILIRGDNVLFVSPQR